MAKYNATNGLPTSHTLSYLMFNNNIWPNSVPLPDIMLRNLSDLHVDLSMSLKVKCGSVIGVRM